LRNVNLSDDIAFRFDDESWNEFPLTAEKFAEWLHCHNEGENINLFLDYETFGIHKKESTGIFDFLNALPGEVLKKENFSFQTATVVLADNHPKDFYDVPQTISWEDKPADNCVWCEHMQQNNTLKKIYSVANLVLASGNENVLGTWGRLQCADYFYYMGSGKNNFASNSPYQSAQTAYNNYMNIVTDFEITLICHNLEEYKKRGTALQNFY
jgi:alpha-amylase